MSYSFATLPISAAAYAEIRAALVAAEYGHAILPNRQGGELLDMQGIALVAIVPGKLETPQQENPFADVRLESGSADHEHRQ